MKTDKHRSIRRVAFLAGLAAVVLSACSEMADTEQVPTDIEIATPALSFDDVTEEAGLAGFMHETGAFGEKWFPESMGSGVAFIDYDGDGWQDILLAGGGRWPESPDGPSKALWLFRNNGDGTFSDRTERAGLGGLDAYGLGLAVGDCDGDGDPDVYLTTLGTNLLLANEAGTFREVDAGVDGEPVWSSSAIFFDADRDGDLDLYVGNYVDWSPSADVYCSLDGVNKSYCTPETYTGRPGRFYRNEGDGTYIDATESAGFLPAPGKTLGVAELDFNRDGWPDLMVANDTQRDLLYVNDGDGTFTERGALSGVAYDEGGKARAGMGVDTGVVDGTEETSIFVGNFSSEMIGVYRHLRDGLFIDRAAASQIGRPSLMSLSFGLFLADLDLDTDLDLFAANGHVQPEIENVQESVGYEERPHLFLNRGDGTFHDAAPEIGGVLAEEYLARGTAFADYDGDGDVDILIAENGGGVHLWRNTLMTGDGDPGFLRVTLVGRESSREGISSRVEAYVDDLAMVRRVRSGSSYMSQSELPVTFGLGERSRVDSLVVFWSSGVVDRLVDVAGNRHVLLVEGSGRRLIQ
ncbi:MAG: CRTAC1 family protein [Rhodothermales bacterium]